MRRWHSEQDLMLRRWRQELANHGRGLDGDGDYPEEGLAPPACSIDVDCHCANGIGTMRKNRPYGCDNPRCAVCHFEKFYVPKARGNKKRAAITFDLKAEQ